MKELKGCYEDSLKLYYMLFDSENTYSDVVNIASLNASKGKELTVGKELYNALYDAYTRSQNGGISIFDGVYNSLRDSLVFSENPYDDDPAVNTESAQLLAELNKVASKENAVTLTFNSDGKSVLFDLSDEYKAFLKKYGLTCPVLDLGLLHDAYLLKYTSDAITARGFKSGYLTTESGLTLIQPDVDELSLCLYDGYDEKDNPITAAGVGAKGNSAGALVRTDKIFSDEYGFYSVRSGNKDLIRHRYMKSFDSSTDVQSVLAIDSKGDIVSAVSLALNMLNTSEDNLGVVLSERSNTDLIYILSGDKTVYATTDKLTVSRELGFDFKRTE